jgi:hypothetical protein
MLNCFKALSDYFLARLRNFQRICNFFPIFVDIEIPNIEHNSISFSLISNFVLCNLQQRVVFLFFWRRHLVSDMNH